MGLFTKNKATNIPPPPPPKLGQDGSDIVAPPAALAQHTTTVAKATQQLPPTAPLGVCAITRSGSRRIENATTALSCGSSPLAASLS